MKQDPTLPSIEPAVISMFVPKQLMVNSGFLCPCFGGLGIVAAILLHIFACLVAFMCMDIEKQTIPVSSEIQVSFQKEEVTPLPDHIQPLSDITDQEEVSVPQPSEPFEPLPDTESFIAMPTNIKKQKLPTKDHKRSLFYHDQSSLEPNMARQVKGASGHIQNATASNATTAKAIPYTQRCNTPSQEYPLASRKRHEQGVVRVGFQILPNGKVEHVHLIQTSGFSGLDRAAIEAVQGMKCRADSSQPTIAVVAPVNFILH